MIHAYLRASTEEQDASRAKEALQGFLDERDYLKDTEVLWHAENHSGRDFDRPVLMAMIKSAAVGDIILVEQIDRLTRLTTDDWSKLKFLLESKRLCVASMDLPSTYKVLESNSAVDKEDTSQVILEAVNRMLIDILAVMASKDYEDRRRRQAEGIARKRLEEPQKYIGKQQTQDTVDKCNLATKYHKDNGLSQIKACKLANVSISTWRRFIKNSAK